ncbi:MAG: hypothetical protein FJ279_30880 [Planctomycetes bacterium]|nr:hypothetical protein [Planctomycetota bacterium]MBM4078268.1 hypothetical protein [Planctomycetota bacterium]
MSVMIIDSHAHLFPEPDYVAKHLAECDRLSIGKVCMSGLGPLFGLGTNEDMKRAMDAHPDRLIGFGYFRLGYDRLDLVDKLAEQGFKGIKTTCPSLNYDDDRFFPVYEKIEKLGWPLLFHTGIVTVRERRRGLNISNDRMRPILLDTLAREFPNMPILCAHLGINWNEEAAEICRFNPNIYTDLSGAMGGWRLKTSAQRLRELLWWPNAFQKVLFGTDVHYTEMAAAFQRDRKLFDELGLDEKTKEGILGGTMARLLKL